MLRSNRFILRTIAAVLAFVVCLLVALVEWAFARNAWPHALILGVVLALLIMPSKDERKALSQALDQDGHK